MSWANFLSSALGCFVGVAGTRIFWPRVIETERRVIPISLGKGMYEAEGLKFTLFMTGGGGGGGGPVTAKCETIEDSGADRFEK